MTGWTHSKTDAISKFSDAKISKETLSDKIANEIINMVAQNNLLPGERLPSERELAATLQVSRLSVREALKNLCTLKVLTAHQTGYYVNSDCLFNLISALDHTNVDDQEDFLRQLQETRLAIEIGAIKVACANYSEEQLAEIIAAQEEMIRSTKNAAQDRAAASLRFHNAIIDASNNQILIAINSCLQEALYHSRRDRSNLIGHYSRSIEEHQLIIEALRARDTGRAAAAMEQHLMRVYIDTPDKLE